MEFHSSTTKLSSWGRKSKLKKRLWIDVVKQYYIWCNFIREANEGVYVSIRKQALTSKESFKYTSLTSIRMRCGCRKTHGIKVDWLKWKTTSRVLCDMKVRLELKHKLCMTSIRRVLMYGFDIHHLWAKLNHKRKNRKIETVRKTEGLVSSFSETKNYGMVMDFWNEKTEKKPELNWFV